MLSGWRRRQILLHGPPGAGFRAREMVCGGGGHVRLPRGWLSDGRLPEGARGGGFAPGAHWSARSSVPRRPPACESSICPSPPHTHSPSSPACPLAHTHCTQSYPLRRRPFCYLHTLRACIIHTYTYILYRVFQIVRLSITLLQFLFFN